MVCDPRRRAEDETLEIDPPGPERNVVSLDRSGTPPGRLGRVFAPRTFGDVTEIADALRARQVAILNLQGADRSLLQRVVDFTSGVAYTIDGKIQKLAEAIYLGGSGGDRRNSANLREQIDEDGMLDLTARFGNRTRLRALRDHRRRHPARVQRALQGYDRDRNRPVPRRNHRVARRRGDARAALEAEIGDRRERISHFKAMEESLQSTLLLAQRTADEVKATAHKEADLLRKKRGCKANARAFDDRLDDARREHQRMLDSPKRPRARSAACYSRTSR